VLEWLLMRRVMVAVLGLAGGFMWLFVSKLCALRRSTVVIVEDRIAEARVDCFRFW